MTQAQIRKELNELQIYAAGLHQKIQLLSKKLNCVYGSAPRKRDIDLNAAMIIEKRNRKIKAVEASK